MSALVLSSAVLTPMLGVALWNLAAAPRLHRHRPRTKGPAVSVLVPARDEAANLGRLLPALLASAYRPLEVVVLDDGSRDGTLAVAREFAASDARVRAVRGLDPPPGWTGKNWACHQLSREATGRILLFCDADVTPGPDAIGCTVAALEERAADALTAFPRHAPGGLLEEAVVPLVAKLPIAALLPLPLVSFASAPSLSAGNGQWFAWRRHAYARAGGHRAIPGDVLEDVRLARRAKAAGLRLVPAVAPRDLVVRMYEGDSALWEGFGKNLYPLVGGHPVGLGLALAVGFVVLVLPLGLPAIHGAAGLIPLALLAALRTASAALFGERPAMVVLHPLGAVLVLGLAAASGWRHGRGRVTWKGRRVAAGRAP